ncbi:DUF4860 domain-containing protein [Anaerotignum sp.]|uniref:DUF4860 domain-containing protein n=1 Tax=Anaerotignum sp. TaxID=2039241 RepID=UPI002714C396|nr:DUF4860 domain-containing protein [Anaerotignum sp.]
MKKQTRFLETIPNLLLFFLFTACMLATLLAGARVYQRVSSVLDAQFSTTTCINYISAKVRHYDKQDGIGMGRLESVDALALYDTYDGEEYVTYIYSFDGYLMELFCSADGQFLPQDGQQIMPIDNFKISLENQMLFVRCTCKEEEEVTVLDIHSKERGN